MIDLYTFCMSDPTPRDPALATPADLAVGEYIDVTLSLAKSREVLPTLGAARLTRIPRSLLIVLAVVALAYLAAPVVLAALGTLTFANASSLILPYMFLPCLLIIAASWFNEPWARFTRVYIAAGRVDIVSFGTMTSYTRETHGLGEPKYGITGPGMLELRGPGYTKRLLRLTPRDAQTVRALWDMPLIAPPFGDHADD